MRLSYQCSIPNLFWFSNCEGELTPEFALPVLVWFSLHSDGIGRMVFLIFWEIAELLTANSRERVGIQELFLKDRNSEQKFLFDSVLTFPRGLLSTITILKIQEQLYKKRISILIFLMRWYPYEAASFRVISWRVITFSNFELVFFFSLSPKFLLWISFLQAVFGAGNTRFDDRSKIELIILFLN